MRVAIFMFATALVGLPHLWQADVKQATAGSTDQTGGAPHGVGGSGWQKLDAGAFSIIAPRGWAFRQQQGADSYVGQFAGDGLVLRFDFGHYSNPLREEKKPAYLVVHKSIGGLRAKIVSPREPGRGVTGIYFPRTFGPNKLCLYGQDLTRAQQELVLKMFETIRFRSAVPAVVAPPPVRERQ